MELKRKTLKIKSLVSNEKSKKTFLLGNGFKFLACCKCGREVKVDSKAISTTCYLCVHKANRKS